MNEEELLRKMRRVRDNLECARAELKNAQNILDQSITFDNEGFKSNEISTLKNKIDRQINRLNNKIIPNINNVQVIQ